VRLVARAVHVGWVHTAAVRELRQLWPASQAVMEFLEDLWELVKQHPYAAATCYVLFGILRTIGKILAAAVIG
jgi:hypothetical protein